MTDEIEKSINNQELPLSLNRESAEKGIAAIDRCLAGVAGIADRDFLLKAKGEAERLLKSGALVGGGAVFVPAGVLGFTEGFTAPDLDISLLGIGQHRFFFFHSALGLVVLRHFHRMWMEKSKDPESWAKRFVGKVAGVALGGFAVGVGVHLAKDLFEPHAIEFPFIGSLIDGTLVDDNIWLMMNSMWAFKISRDVFVLAIGDELAQVRELVKEKFGDKITMGDLLKKARTKREGS